MYTPDLPALRRQLIAQGVDVSPIRHPEYMPSGEVSIGGSRRQHRHREPLECTRATDMAGAHRQSEVMNSERSMPSRRRKGSGVMPLLLALVVSGCATTGGVRRPEALRGIEHRVYDVAAERYIDLNALAVRAAAADVVFFGEQHGHQPGHRLQLALLQALAGHGPVTLSLEMFERDVWALVAGYAAGTATLDSLLAHARPWPRYATDYQPQVDFARTHGWPVLAANVPRSLANGIARAGMALLDTLDAATRGHAAARLHCPDDAYRTRFVEEMRRHPVGDSTAERAAIEQRYYESQCVKDETMAESIAHAIAAGVPRPVVHLTGAFHSDRGDGIPVRVRRRWPDVRIISLTIVPVTDLRTADPTPHTGRADYLLFTRRQN
jgi:uncharacterized iron-regulated protein